MTHKAGDEIYARIGDTLLALLPHVLGGVMLVFVPSKAKLRELRERWHADGRLARMRSLLPRPDALIIDESEGAAAAAATLQRFRDHAAAGAHAARPAVMMLAVMRSSFSEGVNLPDARLVVVIGVPLPAFKDPAVDAKRRYNSARAAAGAALPDGDTWYTQEGVRCAVQAVGRAIRHADDYAAAVFIDCRYAPGRSGSVHAHLPRCIGQSLREVESPQAAAALLPPFYAACAARAAAKAAKAAADAAAAAAVKRERG